MDRKSFELIRGYAFSWIKKWLLEWLFKKILGGAVGGVYGWLLTFGYNFLWKKYLLPLLKFSSSKIKQFFKKKQTKKKVKEFNEAKNEDEFDSAFDNLP